MKKVLIVEDDGAHQYIFKLLAKREGCVADIASDGAEALDLMHTRAYDMIILDMKMPNVNGYGVLNHMNSHAPCLLDHTLVVSTAPDAELDRIRSVYGVAAMSKPFEIADMRQRIHDRLYR